LHLFNPFDSNLFQGNVLKQNREDDARARMVLPSVNDANVLVLQGVKKAARGNYSCRVGNGIPTYAHVVQSKPIFLDVKCKYKIENRIKIKIKVSVQGNE
jgi:hypothetical protein